MKRAVLLGTIAALAVAVAVTAAGGRGILFQAIFHAAGTGSADRSAFSKLSDVVSVKDFGAVGDGTTDDTTAIQAALNTGLNVFVPSATYKITNSLYVSTLKGQQVYGDGIITMDAGLGKPCLWLGAIDSSGTATASVILNTKVRGLRFQGTGTLTSGSSGIAFKSATTTTLDSVYSWGFYAGIDVRGVSLVNNILNADLRQNNIGFWDRTDGTATINFQGSTILGGRFEQNVQEGAVVGSADIHFVGTVFEGNSNQPLGGTGTDSEIRITPGFVDGSVDLTDLYMEITGGNTPTGMIKVDASTNKKITIKGGVFYGNDGTNRCIVNDASAGTVKGYAILGGTFKTFKNYVCGTISNNSTAIILPAWADNSRDATADLTASAGAIIWQFDRTLGLKTGSPIVTTGTVTGLSETLSAAAAATALSLTTGAFINFGGTATLKGDGSQLLTNGNLFLGSSGTSTLHAAVVVRDDTVNSLTLKGTMPDSSGNIGVKITNTTTLTNANTKVACFYPDNSATVVACVDLKGGLVQTGITFANLATGSTANGTMTYCTNCDPASNPCTAAGAQTGSFALRMNGAWKCM